VAPTAGLRMTREEQERVAGLALLFLRARAKLNDMVRRRGDIRGIPFVELDAFVENELFDLKEECHWLFRSQERADVMEASSAMLFDILVGSLFHQCMKTKENAYQVERYEPKYDALRKVLQRPNAPKHVEGFLREGERIIDRARRALLREFNYAVELFDDACVVLRRVLAEHRDSPLLARTLVDNDALVEAVYGQPGKSGSGAASSLELLLNEMYDGHPALGYILAASDLYEGGWYERARELCKRARKLDPKNKQATQLLNKVNAAAHAHLG